MFHLPTPQVCAHSKRPGLVYVTLLLPHTGLNSDVTGHDLIHNAANSLIVKVFSVVVAGSEPSQVPCLLDTTAAKCTKLNILHLLWNHVANVIVNA